MLLLLQTLNLAVSCVMFHVRTVLVHLMYVHERYLNPLSRVSLQKLRVALQVKRFPYPVEPVRTGIAPSV